MIVGPDRQILRIAEAESSASHLVDAEKGARTSGTFTAEGGIPTAIYTEYSHSIRHSLYQRESRQRFRPRALMCAGSHNFSGIEIVKEIEVAQTLRLDRHKILQILVNLISNAQQALACCHQADNRKLVVRARLEDDDRLVINVIDNGPGIEQGDLEKIFNHGFTTKADGHGFGLHSSANAANEMSGNLRASSDGVGRGATFTLEIPIQLR